MAAHCTHAMQMKTAVETRKKDQLRRWREQKLHVCKLLKMHFAMEKRTHAHEYESSTISPKVRQVVHRCTCEQIFGLGKVRPSMALLGAANSFSASVQPIAFSPIQLRQCHPVSLWRDRMTLHVILNQCTFALSDNTVAEQGPKKNLIL